MKCELPHLRIGGYEAKMPIVQGGMSVGISLDNLASAVANEGGIGVIGAAGIGMMEPDFDTNFREANKRALRTVIRKTRSKTNGIVGVNIMVALTDFEELVETAIDEKTDILFLGAGLPLKVPIEEARKRSTAIVPIVSSAKATKLIFDYWHRRYSDIPDGVVVEGPLAGGHLGFKKEQIEREEYQLERILPEVIKVVRCFEELYSRKIPVIAAGGIFTGKDIRKYIEMGSAGVQMATRFVATEECDASKEFKETYVRCTKKDLIIIDSPVGLPGRAINNHFLEEVNRGTKKPFVCPWKCLRTCDVVNSPYCIGSALINAKNGMLNDGFAFAGANAYRIHSITTVKELMKELVEDYRSTSSNS